MRMRHLLGTLLLLGLLGLGAWAQVPDPMSKAGPVMPSKAGMTLPPTPVPNRTVNVPVYTSNYYYGYGSSGYYSGDTYGNAGPAGCYGKRGNSGYVGYNGRVGARNPSSSRPKPRGFPSAARESQLHRAW